MLPTFPSRVDPEPEMDTYFFERNYTHHFSPNVHAAYLSKEKRQALSGEERSLLMPQERGDWVLHARV